MSVPETHWVAGAGSISFWLDLSTSGDVSLYLALSRSKLGSDQVGAPSRTKSGGGPPANGWTGRASRWSAPGDTNTSRHIKTHQDTVPRRHPRSVFGFEPVATVSTSVTFWTLHSNLGWLWKPWVFALRQCFWDLHPGIVWCSTSVVLAHVLASG